MNAIVLRGLFISHPFELIQVEALLLVQELKLLTDSTLIVLKHFHLELVDLFLFILVYIIKL